MKMRKQSYNFSPGDMRGVINPAYDLPEVREIFASLDNLMEHPLHETLLEGRNRIVKAPVEIGGQTQWWVIKKIPVRGLYKKLVYSLRSSKAARSYHNALELMKAGFATPEPIGYLEKKIRGFPDDSCYVSKSVNYDFEVRVFFRGKQRHHEKVAPENFYDQLGRYARDLHRKGFYHNDFTDGNILVSVNGGRCNFFLVDLNRVHLKRRPGLIGGIKGITKLNLPVEERQRLVRSYCGDEFRGYHFLLYRILRALHIAHREGKKPLKKLRRSIKRVISRKQTESS